MFHHNYGGRKTRREDKDKDDYDRKRGGKKRKDSYKKKGTKKTHKRMKKYM